MSVKQMLIGTGAAENRRELRRVQRRRKLRLRGAIFASSIAVLFIASIWPDGGWLHESIETVGITLIITCIVGRAWCILYIGGRKTNELVELGPYSISRNPLYLFTFLGAAGIGFQSGSLLLGVLCVTIAAAVFVPVVLREEAALARTFGEAFVDYARRVPRFGPRLAAWHDADSVSVSPVLLYHTVRDGLVFACAYPIFEVIGYLQEQGHLPVLLHLP